MDRLNPPLRLDPARATLLLVDLQARLLPAMHEPERVLANALRLARGAMLLGLPVTATEQYPRGLGPTVPAVTELLSGVPRVEKMAFSAIGEPGLAWSLRARGQVLLAGIESHVCVCQTGLDLLAAGIATFVVADAVSSRTPENARLGVERLRDAGAVVVSTEMALFELLGSAATAEFKAVQNLVK
jgi:nicotinamidase-related amidase